MNELQHTPPKKQTGAVWIMLSVALILFSCSIIAIPLGIAALVFAIRLRKAMIAGDEVAVKAYKRTCTMLLLLGLVAALVSGAVGITALLYKYGKITL